MKQESDKKMPDIEYSDRYGGHYPDHATICKGHCEGMGCYPVYIAAGVSYSELMRKNFCEPSQTDFTMDEYLAWLGVHRQEGEHQCDGSHFITCPTCKGSGRQLVSTLI